LLGCSPLEKLRADAAEAAEAHWTITQAVTSDYFFRGVRLAGPSLQPAVEFNRKTLSLGAWSNVALTDTGKPTNPEVDLYGAFRIRSGSDAVELVPGFTLYTYLRAHHADGIYRTTFEPSVGANIDVHGLRLTPKVYYDFTLEGATYELSAALAFALKSLGTELDLNASVGTFKLRNVTPDADPREKNWGDYFNLNASVPYRVSSTATVSLSIGYSVGTNNYFKQAGVPRSRNPDARSRALVSLSYSVAL
jgi:uncharacterized protein (TIGR02001 family)